MHVHTLGMSADSELKPGDLPAIALAAGLTGVNLAEHDKVWPRDRQRGYADGSDLFVNFGMEVSTDLGHMIAIGLPEYVGGIRRAEKLREEIDRVGGFLIVAHPFRYTLDPATVNGRANEPILSVEQAAELPVFQIVHAIEVANACNTLAENEFAASVARLVGLPTTGGSDAHSHAGVGHFATGFAEAIQDERDLLGQLHAGTMEAVHRTPSGRLVRFEPGSVEAAAREGAPRCGTAVRNPHSERGHHEAWDGTS